MAGHHFCYWIAVFLAFSAEAVDIVKYKSFKAADTAAKAFINKEDKGPMPSKFHCGAICNLKNQNWPEKQCNAFGWDADTLACEIGSYDTEYVADTGDTPLDEDLIVSTMAGIGMDYLLYVGGTVDGATVTAETYVQMEDGSFCTGHDVPNMPQPRTGAAAVLHHNKKIYVVGGKIWQARTPTESVMMLDLEEPPATRAWETKAPTASAKIKCAIATYGDNIFTIGGLDDNTIEEYDTIGDSWTLLATLPFFPALSGWNYNTELVQIAEDKVWVVDPESDIFYQFDMDTRTLRLDVDIPVCPIDLIRVTAVDVGHGKTEKKILVLATDPKLTRDVYIIDPEDLAVGWTKLGESFPALMDAGPNILVALHRERLAMAQQSHADGLKWWHYDHGTGKFEEKGFIPGFPQIGGNSNSAIAVPAVHFPECRT